MQGFDDTGEMSPIVGGGVRLAAITSRWVFSTGIARTLRCGDTWVDRLPALAERLGPAYVKLAQLVSTRADIIPASLGAALGRLQENGSPLSADYLREQLAAAGLVVGDAEPEPRMLGAGSIACVYLLSLHGREPMAVKVLRPEVRKSLDRDLRSMRRAARIMARIPPFRRLPVVDMVDHATFIIAGQSSFRREAGNLETLRARLAGHNVFMPALIDVPNDDVLCMEYLSVFDGHRNAERADVDRKVGARALVEAVFLMLFDIGIVHCDLHPGNVAVDADGVHIVDAGFVAETTPDLRRQFREFFLGLSFGNGPRCAESVIDAAVIIPSAFDREEFVARMTDLVGRYANLPAAKFNIGAFVAELFTIQRNFDIYVSAEFVIPILTLLVIEGTIRDWDPDLDFQRIAQPIILRAVVRDREHGTQDDASRDPVF